MGGHVVGPQGRRQVNLYVSDGKVALVDDGTLPAVETVDASGKLVLPGMVDTHVHLMDPGDTTREDFPAGTTAAAVSGVTTIIEHTHGHPVRSVTDLDEKLAHLRHRSRVDYALAAHVWPDRIGELAALWEAGIAFFKVFTCATHGVPAVEGETLASVLTEVARFRGNCLIHCEDDSITATAEKRLREEGRTDPGVLLEWRNREAEEVAVAAVTILARHSGARVSIAHVSTPAVAEMVTSIRAEGADVVAEACPQYFHLWEEEIHTEGALRKFTPPARIRSVAEEAEMWGLLGSGAFGHISTDHAPSTLAQKTSGDIWEVHFGIPGLDTTMALLMTAVNAGRLTWEGLVGLYSTAPARRYGLFPAKGHLEAAADADFLLIDPDRRWRIGDRPLWSKAGWSPYTGREAQGWVDATYLRGRAVAVDGAPVNGLSGRFLPRTQGSGVR